MAVNLILAVSEKPKRKRSVAKPPGTPRKPYGQRVPLEVGVESYLSDRVRRAGGHCIKLPANQHIGIPDRLVILPNYIIFVELKRPEGGRVAKLQKWWQEGLRTMGHYAAVIRSKAEIDQLLKDFT